MALIQTVRGAIDGAELGRTLAHEHVVNVTDWVQRDYPDLSWGDDRTAVIERIGARLREIKARGIDAIIDCTAMGHSRDIPAVAEANALADIHIVVATGLYTYDALPYFFLLRPPPAPGEGEDIMTAMFVRDIKEGIQGTGIKAGIIKCATDKPGLTPNIERILRAAARAHRLTGVPITTHTDVAKQTGLLQQELFRNEGVDLSRVVIGHSGDSSDIDYLQRLLDAGSFIGADRFGLYRKGWPTLADRVETVRRLVSLGYEEQILLSHDASIFSDWRPQSDAPNPDLPPQWQQCHIPDEVVPAMQEAGISRRAIDKMLIDNPRRLLAHGDSY